jgi:predicted HicB family RNase H-like nuclease
MTHANKGNQNAAKSDQEKATSTLICRIHPTTKAQWVKAAQKDGKKLTQWVTDTLNSNAKHV